MQVEHNKAKPVNSGCTQEGGYISQRKEYICEEGKLPYIYLKKWPSSLFKKSLTSAVCSRESHLCPPKQIQSMYSYLENLWNKLTRSILVFLSLKEKSS